MYFFLVYPNTLHSRRMNGPTVVIILIVCMLVMHVSTLVIFFYKDRIMSFLDEMSTDVLLSEMSKRGLIPATTAAVVAQPTYDSLEPALQYRPWNTYEQPVDQRALPAPAKRPVRQIMPLQDSTDIPAAPCDMYQPFLHPAFGQEYGQNEGLVTSDKTVDWNAATARSYAPQNCKNYVNLNIA